MEDWNTDTPTQSSYLASEHTNLNTNPTHLEIPNTEQVSSTDS